MQQINQEVVDECIGCKEDILEGDEVLLRDEGLLHDEKNCIVEFVRETSFIGIATKNS